MGWCSLRQSPHVVLPGDPDFAGAPVPGFLAGHRDVAVPPILGISSCDVDLAGGFIAPVLLALNLRLQQSIPWDTVSPVIEPGAMEIQAQRAQVHASRLPVASLIT
jgi:hypothetical protein